MISSFVTTIKWVANSLRVGTNRCAAVLMRNPAPHAAARPPAPAQPPQSAPPAPLPARTPTASVSAGDAWTPTTFDPAHFDVEFSVFALRVPPRLCSGVRAALRAHVLQMPRTPCIVKPIPAPDPPHVLLLLRYLSAALNASADGAPIGNADDAFSTQDTNALAAHLRTITLSGRAATDAAAFVHALQESDISTRAIRLHFAQWPTEQILRRLLPTGVVVPTSFETVGTLIHLNLRPEHETHRHLIGEVLLAKLSPRVRTIVNKTKATSGPFRTFAMELLAGDPSTATTVRENGCTFALDLARVYWNSRLETEHRRIVDAMRPAEVFADAFCGVGPFAVPAAKRARCKAVYANDLNPASVEYLRRNIETNGVADGKVVPSCGCARDFLRRIVRVENVPVSRVTMNFPAGAPEFLDVFRGLYTGLEELKLPMPIVHCYCFIRDAEGKAEARRRVRKALFNGEEDGTSTMSDDELDVRTVRDVAPRKVQVCVTFTIPTRVAYWSEETEERAKKRQKTST